MYAVAIGECSLGHKPIARSSGQAWDVRFVHAVEVVMVILWIILAVVLVIWLVGLLADIAGNLIHFLLLVALVILVYNLVTGRRSV